MADALTFSDLARSPAHINGGVYGKCVKLMNMKNEILLKKPTEINRRRLPLKYFIISFVRGMQIYIYIFICL